MLVRLFYPTYAQAHVRTRQNMSAFHKVGECLYRYSSNGVYYARFESGGKEIRRSLRTTDRAPAQRALAWLKEERKQVDPAQGKLTLGGALRSLLADDPASKTENGRAQGAHHSPPQIRLADRQTYSGYENQAVACPSVDFTLSLWPCFPQSTRGGNQTHFRNGRARWNHLAISGRAPTASETGKANPCHSEL